MGPAHCGASYLCWIGGVSTGGQPTQASGVPMARAWYDDNVWQRDAPPTWALWKPTSSGSLPVMASQGTTLGVGVSLAML
jgi:hypothetical protein